MARPSLKPPKIIAVVTQKGGAGKTTLSMMLAFAAHRDLHKPVLVLDGDPSRGSALWADGVQPEDGVIIREAAISDYGKPWDRFTDTEPAVIIIDNPPFATEPMLRAMDVADLVVIPSKSYALDAAQTALTYRAAIARKRRAVVVPNMMRRGTLEETSFPAALDEFGVEHTTTMIHERSAYGRAVNGVPVDLGEFTQLWEELKRMLR